MSTLQHQGSRINPELSVLSFFADVPHVRVDTLRVFQFPPNIQKHASRELARHGVNMCVHDAL